MDAEKDKPQVPEKSPEEANNENKEDDKKENNENQPEKQPAPDQGSPKKDGADSESAPIEAAPSEGDQPKSEKADGAADESSENKEKEENPDEAKPEEEQKLDLGKVSEEVDQYISTLPAVKGCVARGDHESTATVKGSGEGSGDHESTAAAEAESETKTEAEAETETKAEAASLPEVPAFVEQFALLVEAKIADYDSSESPVRWNKLTEDDAASFLDAMIRLSSLSKALSRFSSDEKYASSINRIELVLERAISYVEEELKLLLEEYKIDETGHPIIAAATNAASDEGAAAVATDANTKADGGDAPSGNAEGGNEEQADQKKADPPPEEPPAMTVPTYFPEYTEENLSHLVKLSQAMIAGGHEMECHQAYFVARRNALEHSLHRLGFEKRSIDDVQRMSWESLERDIAAWIKSFRQCATVHFTSERKLSDAVFADQTSISETLFCSLAHGVMIQLLNFAEAIALTKRAAEKLFKFLDLYEALRDVLPTMEDSFPEEWMNEIKTEASIIKGRLGEAMILIFSDMDSSIKADAGKSAVAGGAVHPLTRYIMNYLRYACEYKETLDLVFREHQKIERADSATGSDYNYNAQAQNINTEVVKQSPFQTQMIKVMDLLDENLEGKSKLYKDHSLGSIFMMNNGRYILQKVRGSTEMNTLLGDSWCRKRSSDLRQYHKTYQRETWGRLLSSFHPDGLMSHGKVVKPVLKDRFNSFNKMFDEIHKTQSTWIVSDEQLQSELRVSISNMVIPAYRSFLGRYSSVFTPGRQTEKYVKYQPEDIETYIDELFDGNAAPMGRRKI